MGGRVTGKAHCHRRRFAPASVKAVVGKERMTPSAREVMLGITAALVPQFLLLVKILSTETVDKFSW
jgi:hypothetical protein